MNLSSSIAVVVRIVIICCTMVMRTAMCLINAALLATGSGSVPIWPLGAAVSIFAAGATVAADAAVCVFPEVDSLGESCGQWVSGT